MRMVRLDRMPCRYDVHLRGGLVDVDSQVKISNVLRCRLYEEEWQSPHSSSRRHGVDGT